MPEQYTNRQKRAREAGIILGTMSPGPTNTIADVAGVRVGHATMMRGSGALVRGSGPVRTGVTAILPHEEDLFTAVVEVTEEAVINALCASRSMDGRDDHHVEALPLEEVVDILRHYGWAA